MDKIKYLFTSLFIFGFFTIVSPILATSIVVNELMPNPSSGNDWVELYNTTSDPVDLTSWTLVDSTSTMTTLSGSITGTGFLVVEVSTRLNMSADTVTLKDAVNATIDTYSYSENPGTDVSFGRSPDGGSWATLTTSSKGSSNGSAVPTSTPTPTPTNTPTPTPTSEPASTSTPTPAPTNTPTPTLTPSPTGGSTPTPTPIKTPTPTKTSAKNTTPTTPFTPTPDFQAQLPESILGTSASATPTPTASESSSFPLKNLLLIAGGSVFILSGVFIATFVIRRKPEQL